MKQTEQITIVPTDDKDKAILNVVLKNSRLSLREIAKKVGLSVATVMNRLQALEKKGVIEQYGAKIDYEKLGYDVQVIIEIQIAKGKLFQVEKKIAKHPNVFAVYDTTGDFDVVIIARFRSRRTMDNFLKKIQKEEFIIRTRTKLILNIIKEEPIEVK